MMELLNLIKVRIQISTCFDKTVILLDRKLLKNLIFLIFGFTVAIFSSKTDVFIVLVLSHLKQKLDSSELIGQSKENKIISSAKTFEWN